jgi:long-chain acyl-CoA synthetase
MRILLDYKAGVVDVRSDRRNREGHFMTSVDKSLVNRVIPYIEQWSGSLHCYDGEKIATKTTKNLSFDVRRCAALLRAKGVAPGDGVGILGGNSYAWVVLDLACLACGAYSVGFDPNMPKGIEELKADLGIVHFFELPADATMSSLLGEMSDAIAAEALPAHVYAPEEVVSVKFTSGSTGTSKAIAVKRKSVDDSLTNVQHMFAHGPGDTILVFLPLHLLQQRYWIYSAVIFSHDVVVVPYHLAFAALQRHRPTVVMGVPEFFESAISGFDENRAEDRAAFARLLGGNIRYLWTGSAPIGLSTLEKYSRMGVPIFQGYGMNETCIVSKNYPGHDRLGSVGQVVASKRVEFGPEGELLVWSDYEVNTRYANRPAVESALTFRPDGFVATGDTGYLDADGYLYITGRVKDIIVLANGRKVAPIPIEKRLESTPSIERAVVFGGAMSSLVAVLAPRSRDLGREALAADVAAYNATADAHERVSKFVVADDGITQAQGLLTSQFKVRRQAVEQKFATQLALLEASDREPAIQAESL